MGEKALKSKRYGAYKTIRNLFYVCLIPLLLVAIFSGYVMINSKAMGGYPSAFGYTVVKIKNNNFYNVNDSQYFYKQGDDQLFQKIDASLYEFNAIIAYYSGNAEDTESFNEAIDWRKDSTINANRSLFRNTDTTSEQAEVSIGQIIDISEPTTIGNKDYILLAVSNAQNDSSNYKVIIAEDVIGVAIPNNQAIISTLQYCSAFDSFITLMLIPCVLLITLNILKALILNKFLKEDLSGQKEKYLKQEAEREGKSKQKNIDKQKFAEELREVEAEIKKPPVRPVRPVRPTTAPIQTAESGVKVVPKTPPRPIPKRVPGAMATPSATTKAPIPAVRKPPVKPPIKPPVKPSVAKPAVNGVKPKTTTVASKPVTAKTSTTKTVSTTKKPASTTKKTVAKSATTNKAPSTSKPATAPRKPPVKPVKK